MAVYTHVSESQAQAVCDLLGLGQCVALKPIAGGIENTNYFLTTQRSQEAPIERVLTLFERLHANQLPYYLGLMGHLAARGVAVPEPVSKPSGLGGHPMVLELAGKPACVVARLGGASELAPTPLHCQQLGRTLAAMHLAGASYDARQPNLRGLAWWNDTAPLVLPHLSADQAALLSSELAYQNHISNTPAYQGLAQGAVHADLFRDNVMFSTNAHGQPQLTGVFDFYFAGHDHWLFDLCVALNDWAIDLDTGEFDAARRHALLNAYTQVRALSRAERQLMPAMLRAAALRFWVSRLWDWHRPREAELLKPHDPRHFERVLRCRLAETGAC